MTYSEQKILLGFTAEEWAALSDDDQKVEIENAIMNMIDWSIKADEQ